MSTSWKVCSFLHSCCDLYFTDISYLTRTFNVNSPLLCQYLRWLWVRAPVSWWIVSPVVHMLCLSNKVFIKRQLSFEFHREENSFPLLSCRTGNGFVRLLAASLAEHMSASSNQETRSKFSHDVSKGNCYDWWRQQDDSNRAFARQKSTSVVSYINDGFIACCWGFQRVSICIINPFLLNWSNTIFSYCEILDFWFSWDVIIRIKTTGLKYFTVCVTTL